MGGGGGGEAKMWPYPHMNVSTRSLVKGAYKKKKFLFLFQNIYSCPMKTHHSTDAHCRGLSKAVQNCVIYNHF